MNTALEMTGRMEKHSLCHNISNIMRDPTMPSFAYIVVYIVCVCYYRSLDGTFVFDDNFAIVKNPDVVKGFGWDVFVNDFWGMPIRNILK